MERGPREVTVEMLPNEQQPLVRLAQANKTKVRELREAGKFSVADDVDTYLMQQAKNLRRYAEENFGTTRHLQKVPSWQVMMGGSLEQTHVDTPPELVTYVEERVRDMITHIDAMIRGE